MKSLFRLFLVVAAVFGMLGGATASAMSSPQTGHLMMGVNGKMAMVSSDCMKSTHATKQGSEPCKKMTMQCMADMGCAAPSAIAPESLGLNPVTWTRAPHLATVAHPLANLSSAPEPNPPSLLV